MANFLQKALNSKLGMKLQGKSVVDNTTDPTSAYSRARNGMAAGTNPKAEAVGRAIQKTYANSKGKTFGTPLK